MSEVKNPRRAIFVIGILGLVTGIASCGAESDGSGACEEGALEERRSSDGCTLCRCARGEWTCESWQCVTPECPPPALATDGCPDQASFSRDPETGGCCRYDNLCAGPVDWPSFNGSQKNCEEQTPRHCEPDDAVPAGDGCNQCVCNAEGERWECSDDACSPTSPPPGKACGFFEGGCPSGEYCAFNPPEQCSHFDAPSVCRPLPEECTDEVGTVCGCDGRTYGNRCLAARAGTGIIDVGPCPEVRPPTPCGADYGNGCGDDEYCAFDEAIGCDENGAEAECRLRPLACVEQLSPVCGCDFVTYPNACFAAMAGAGVYAYGECR